MLLGSPTPEGCRVAPYVNMPSMRLAFDRLHVPHLTSPHVDLSAMTAVAAAAAAGGRLPPVTSLSSPMTSPLTSAIASTPLLFYPPPPYFMNFPGAAGFAGGDNPLAPNKNSSIADLRLKAKQHAAALGLDYGLKT